MRISNYLEELNRRFRFGLLASSAAMLLVICYVDLTDETSDLKDLFSHLMMFAGVFVGLAGVAWTFNKTCKGVVKAASAVARRLKS